MATNNHDYEQVHLNDDDADSESIELVQGRRLQRTLGSGPSAESTTSSSSSTIIRWVIISCLMIGMYMLGTKQGESDVLDDKGTKQHKNKDKHKNYGTSFTLERVQNT
eukprot:scaffold628_cov88-Skeletonema_dohrnii-CCMP3373.AAC.5